MRCWWSTVPRATWALESGTCDPSRRSPCPPSTSMTSFRTTSWCSPVPPSKKSRRCSGNESLRHPQAAADHGKGDPPQGNLERRVLRSRPSREEEADSGGRGDAVQGEGRRSRDDERDRQGKTPRPHRGAAAGME